MAVSRMTTQLGALIGDNPRAEDVLGDVDTLMFAIWIFLLWYSRVLESCGMMSCRRDSVVPVYLLYMYNKTD